MSQIKLLSIAEIMDGRTFFIPSYQRGYRWTTKEITDLLDDLYSFALKPGKQSDEFYCLQPIITQRITDEDFVEYLFIEGHISTNNKCVWTIIDGQQRLTSVYILYRYLLEKKNWSAEDLMSEENKELFHLAYETREETSNFLENLNSESLDDSDIDRFNISNAYRIIENWISSRGREISDIAGRRNTPNAVREVFFELLNCPKGVTESTGSAQFIWYEIDADNGIDRNNEISEFLKINTGKIELTDAELLKALFLQTRNFEKGEKEIKQLQIALEWEQIENTLHQNDFWHFFYGSADRPNRIDAIFELIYKADHISKYDVDIKESVKALSKDLKVKNTLFRFFYGKLDGKSGDALQTCIKTEWQKIMNAFHTLEDWYEDTKVYNNVGFLSHCGVDIAQMYIKFSLMEDTETKEDLEDYFNDLIKQQLSAIIVEDGHILSTYDKNRDAIFKLLLLLNVHQQNLQYDRASENDDDFNGNIFKFPYDIFDRQNWNVEHIDSYTTNLLRDTNDKREWCKVALEEMEKANITSSEVSKIRELFNLGSYGEIIERVKGYFEKGDDDEDNKNLIGNLTLLDEKTNKSYGNRLFCTKKRIIQERAQAGSFIPGTTKWVFDKYYSGGHSSDIYWTDEDKEAYQDFIVKQLKPYLTIRRTSDGNLLF